MLYSSLPCQNPCEIQYNDGLINMFCVLFLAGSQYGALVVSMADQAGEGETTEGQAGEGKDATIAVPALTEGAREFDKCFV